MYTPIDVEALKREHPIADVVGRYGIELRPSGRTLLGRCPFHDDHGRPNLVVYPDTASWYCFRCNAGGDVFEFVERMEGINFREAADRLGNRAVSSCTHRVDGAPVQLATPARCQRYLAQDAGHRTQDVLERACLAAAVEIYHNRLLSDFAALTYVLDRGINRDTIDRYRIGFACGDELRPYLRWRRLPLPAARKAGLIRKDDTEFFAGRVVVPEIRDHQPIWMIGRVIAADCPDPRYLGLPGPKPLLGWDSV